MSASPDATLLLEQGVRVFLAWVHQAGRGRQQRAIRGLALNPQAKGTGIDRADR
jgi:hypothetical protein